MHQAKAQRRVGRLNGFKWRHKNPEFSGKATRKEGGHFSPSYSIPSNTESQDGVKEGNEGEEGMKNKGSERRNAMKKEETRNVKTPLRE